VFEAKIHSWFVAKIVMDEAGNLPDDLVVA
jgi:hypothetical protein